MVIILCLGSTLVKIKSFEEYIWYLEITISHTTEVLMFLMVFPIGCVPSWVKLWFTSLVSSLGSSPSPSPGPGPGTASWNLLLIWSKGSPFRHLVVLSVNAWISNEIHGPRIDFLGLPKMKACVCSLIMIIYFGEKFYMNINSGH